MTLEQLFDFLFQIVKQRRAEKFTQRDLQTVAELFDQIDRHLFATGIQHAVHAGGSYAGTVGQFVGFDAALFADFLKAVGYGLLDAHVDHLRKEDRKLYAFECTQLRIFANRYIMNTAFTQLRHYF